MAGVRRCPPFKPPLFPWRAAAVRLPARARAPLALSPSSLFCTVLWRPMQGHRPMAPMAAVCVRVPLPLSAHRTLCPALGANTRCRPCVPFASARLFACLCLSVLS